ncbi:cytochrome P450 [Parafrankia sp. EAN1pec]|uniref:cytochrome P450 n=1 Tax=Parafrankia sp. (strain EAN1pec) TaxID=298653 RepID=UPI0000544097|nr:cytochrome P450 [Frankia sp. EAN1pec]
MRFDPTAAAIKADPYPAYARLRAEAPVEWNDLGFWTVARHQDCLFALRDKRLGKEHPFAWAIENPDLPLIQIHDAMMIFHDGQAHRRVRRLFTSAFTTRAADRLRPDIAAIVDELLAELVERDEFDLVSQFCYPVTLRTICYMLGVPRSDIDWCHSLTKNVQRLLEQDLSRAELVQISDSTVTLSEYFAEHVRDRRRNPKDDLISLLVQAEIDGERLTEEEIIANSILLYLGGEDTNANLMANSTLALLAAPDQAELLRHDAGVVHATAFDELLRYDSSFQMLTRYANEPVEIGGQRIEEGQTVMCLLGSANRDEREYERPDELDLRRVVKRGVSFGGGPHLCVGAPLARAQLQEALPRLFRAFPWMQNLTEELEYPLLVVRGPKELTLATGKQRVMA